MILLEWALALIGAAICIWAPLGIAQNQSGSLWPLPWLYLIEIALTGLLALLSGSFRGRALAPARAWIPWASAGILLAFVILAGFSIGPALIPACLAFFLLGLLRDRTHSTRLPAHILLAFIVAILQGALMLLLVRLVNS